MTDNTVAVVSLGTFMFACHCVLIYSMIKLFVCRKPIVERREEVNGGE